MDARAAEAARGARCGRCRELLLESGTAEGFLSGYYRVMALRQTVPFQLCGTCGIGLREYLNPELVTDPEFQQIKDSILEGWARGQGMQGLPDGEGETGRPAA